jgi:hypothetical protein
LLQLKFSKRSFERKKIFISEFLLRDINDNPPVFIWPDSTEIHHILSDDHSQRIDSTNPSYQFITDIIIQDNDLGNNSLIKLTNSAPELFYIGINNSLWLRNTSILPGTYELELQAKNYQYQTKKNLHIIIYQYNPLGLNLFNQMSKTIGRIPMLIMMIILILTMSLLIYYLCLRKNVEKQLYGSRLIVNDEDKSKENSPQTKLTTGILPINNKNEFAVITKQRKVCLCLECVCHS